MNRQAQALLLFLIGAAVLRASATNLYLRYVKAGLRPLLLAAAVLLIVAAVATVWYDRKERGQHEPWIAWLLVLPLFALVVVTPPALGSYAAQRTGTALQRPLAFAALPAGDPLRLTVLDYAARAVYDHGRSLGSRRVTISGFVTIGPGGAPYLTRMVLSCCAADALPVKVGLAGQVPPGLASDTWLEVTGTYVDKQIKDVVNDAPIPFIEVSQAHRVPAPADPYQS